MLLRHSGVIAGAAFALCAVAASAQPAPAEHGRHVQRQERTVVIRRGDDMGAHQAEHLRAILQLKPAQEGALSAYLEAMRPAHDRDHMMRMRGEGRARTTPEKLARMEARMTEREAAMRARIAATKRFYDQLDPAQKRAFDELPLVMGGPPMPMMGGMKIMHRGHGPGARFGAEHFGEPMPPLPPRPPVPPRS
jgi:hypothetical protein